MKLNYGKGWFFESYRHSLAAKGIKTVFKPMRPVFTDSIPRNHFVVERKYDGARMLLVANKKGIKLINRRQVDKTKNFPELRDVYKKLNFRKSVKLDGELVVFANGESFKLLSSRNHLQDPKEIKIASEKHPATYIAFDILEKDGTSLHKVPLIKRKEILDKVVPDNLKRIKEIEYSKNLKEFLKFARKQKAEGVVFKDIDSFYKPGRSSKDWQKFKFKKQNDFVVIGYKPGSGKRAGKVGALVLAVNGTGLKYKGLVGTGFTDKELNEITKKVRAIEVPKKPKSYPKIPSEHKIRFVKPKLVVRIEGVVGTRGRIREPVFQGFRTDITPMQTHDIKY